MQPLDVGFGAGSAPGGPIRVFVGTDEKQRLAAEVLSWSIHQHTSTPVEVTLLDSIATAEPETPEFRSRTGFSFRRFAIPALCGFRGRAIYLDADMLVFGDLQELWSWPMDHGVAVLGVAPSSPRDHRTSYSVMVLACDRLDWDIDRLIVELDAGQIDYEGLVYGLECVNPAAKRSTLPTRWNSLERHDLGVTALLHYTDIPRQPWIYPYNPNGDLWYDALRAALNTGGIAPSLVAHEINAGHVSPNLPDWIGRPIEGACPGRRGWLPPYLQRIRDQRDDLPWRLRCAMRQYSTWAPWLRRILDKFSGHQRNWS